MKFDVLVESLLNEAIPLHIAKNSLSKKHNPENYQDFLLNKIFKGKDRIILPFNVDKKLLYRLIEDDSTYKEIQTFLHSLKKGTYGNFTNVIKNFNPESYVNGIIEFYNDKNQYKIGKILEKNKAIELLQKYKSDPNRQLNSEYVVVISRHPYDLAGASTDRHWTSCINRAYEPIIYKNTIKKNQFLGFTSKTKYDKSYFDQDKKRYENHRCDDSGLIAYLVNKKELMPNGKIKLHKPISRLFFGLRSYINENEIYGVHSKEFLNTIKKWISSDDVQNAIEEYDNLSYEERFNK
jgi:hypothetical protein